MKNILITGAFGQLGRCLMDVMGDSDINCYYSDISDNIENECSIVKRHYYQLDITDFNKVRLLVNQLDIDTIINCAAYTNVDKAEDDEENAHKINVEGVKNLAIAMKSVNGLLIHISTDYVFGGDKYNTPIREHDNCSPLGVYGKTKRDGELEIIKTDCKYVIIRTAWLYSEYGNNFVKTMTKLLREKSKIKVVFDQVGTPTYAKGLALAINEIVKKPIYGIYHYSDEGVCSWYDLACVIKNEISSNCTINPCHSDEYPTKAKRPNYSVLDKTKIKSTYNISINEWIFNVKWCVFRILFKGFKNIE